MQDRADQLMAGDHVEGLGISVFLLGSVVFEGEALGRPGQSDGFDTKRQLETTRIATVQIFTKAVSAHQNHGTNLSHLQQPGARPVAIFLPACWQVGRGGVGREEQVWL